MSIISQPGENILKKEHQQISRQQGLFWKDQGVQKRTRNVTYFQCQKMKKRIS